MEKSNLLEEIEKRYQKRLETKMANSSSLGMDKENILKIDLLFKQLSSLPSSCSRLSLPKRRELDGYKEIISAIGGNFLVALEIFAESNLPGQEIVGDILSNQVHRESMRAANISKTAIEALVIQLRFEINKGSFFSLREGLNKALIDMDVGDKVPSYMLRSPFNYTYIEFEEAERRGDSGFTCFFKDREMITEGAYVINNDKIDLSIFSDSLIEGLELDKKLPTRLIEICLTSSPHNSDDTPVYGDLSNIIPIFIQDENEPVIDVLERTFSYYTKVNDSVEFKMLYGPLSLNKNVIISIEKAVKHLIKVFLYINSDKSITEVKNEKSNLINQLERISEKKKNKIKNRIIKSYDRIILGPNKKYIPINEIIEKNYKSIKGVKPHFRRGVIGIRWTGKGRGIPKATWISPSIINKNKMVKDEDYLKDYYVFL